MQERISIGLGPWRTSSGRNPAHPGHSRSRGIHPTRELHFAPRFTRSVPLRLVSSAGGRLSHRFLAPGHPVTLRYLLRSDGTNAGRCGKMRNLGSERHRGSSIRPGQYHPPPANESGGCRCMQRHSLALCLSCCRGPSGLFHLHPAVGASGRFLRDHSPERGWQCSTRLGKCYRSLSDRP